MWVKAKEKLVNIYNNYTDISNINKCHKLTNFQIDLSTVSELKSLKYWIDLRVFAGQQAAIVNAKSLSDREPATGTFI